MRLAQFHSSVKRVVREACENALKAEGFVPDPIDIGTYLDWLIVMLHYLLTQISILITWIWMVNRFC